MAGGAPGDRSLKETPAWAVASVCAVFVILSVLIEHGIHSLAKWFQKRQKKALLEALEKIKAELMLLGFISLLITVGQKPISKICIPKGAGDTMLPCKKELLKEDADTGKDKDDDAHDNDRRRLLWYAGNALARRVLAAADGDNADHCSKKNKVPLVSQSGIHQLHIFIFMLAVLHVVYSVLTIVLARAKVKKWKSWEQETASLHYQFSNDPSRFRFVHQTSFVRQYNGFSTMPGIRWIAAFFRQFFCSVTKADYLTMRHGFINAHFAANSKFDFHKYIKRSMEDDFKVVVGISIPLWTFAILFLALNVYRWYTLFVISLLPPITLFIIGAKLQIIMMDMALQIQHRTTVVTGVPIVEPSNKYFWFNRPHFILGLIHFTSFENAFQISYFLWTWYEFGLSSCFHENLPMILVKIFLGVLVQVLGSYITFPLYSLVTQMGSHMKKAIFEEQTAKALMKWQKAAKERRKLRKIGGDNMQSDITSGNTTPSRGSSPLHLLHKYKTSSDLESNINSPTRGAADHNSDTEYSETEGPVLNSSDDQNNSRNHHKSPKKETVEKHEIDSSDFSFSKSWIER